MSNSDGPASLFDALHQLLKRYWLTTESDAAQGVLSFPPSEEDQLARVLFSKLETGGFATLVVSGRRRWNPESNYFESARAAARRGCKITRAFLLPHRQYLNDEVLRQHWLEDERAGIEVLALYVSDLLSMSTVPPPATLDIGIWDDSLTCSSFSHPAGSERGVVEWRVSARAEDVQLAESLRDELLTKAEKLPAPGTAPTAPILEEPMVRTAPLAELLANTLCRGAYVSPDDCSWYHGFWQYLRIFDLVSTPTWHSTFYLSELERLAQASRPLRILISGTADYSVLAHVLWSFRNRLTDLSLTVLDLCETPLILCRWYAKQIGKEIETVCIDVNSFEPDASYDCIITDAFLTRFGEGDRREILRSWRRLLSTTGVVLTTVRLNGGSEVVAARPEQVDSFRERARQQAQRWQDFIPITVDEVAVRAQRYAERMISHPVSSETNLRALFEELGYRMRRCEMADVKGEMVRSTYARIVADAAG